MFGKKSSGNVIVAGMGQGGMVAAMYLALAGFKVDIFEKAPEGKVSYPWYDDITFNIFEKVGIPEPPRECYTQKSKWLFVSPDEKNSLAVPPMPPMVEVSISRRGLNEHLCDLAKGAGCTLHYGEEVEELQIFANKVTGVKTSKGTYKADLVIDATGLFSKLRRQVPKKFGIQAEPAHDDLMSGYRAFFRRRPGSATPDPESTLYVMHKNGAGISWCNLNDRDEVDMLCLRIGGISKEEYEDMATSLRAKHDIVSDEVIMAPRPVNVGVRYTMARLVADGYAAVGDSAFMTMPFMGSGIEASMQAGRMLAETVINGGKNRFSVKNLWNYQVKFFKKLGALYIAIDIVKRYVLFLDPETVNWVFGCGAVTSEDMKLLSTDENNEAGISPLEIVRKVMILLSKPKLILGLLGAVTKAARGFALGMLIPKKYNEREIKEWQKEYEKCIKHVK
ncbi:MAG: FAD-dependent monooxygenase [Clostridia bacterium]|nr:FAD-dependent monooxygenase [Clostridia bacterium]MBR6512625.1 FAD-dependent monooxygenase [Clostridia bacterium]